jgi:hypothetical protein
MLDTQHRCSPLGRGILSAALPPHVGGVFVGALIFVALRVRDANFPLSPWGEGWGEGAVK